MVAAPAVVADHDFFEHVQPHQVVAVFFNALPGDPAVLGVVAVAAPAVECAVVVGLLHGQEHVVVFQDVPAPFAFADVDPGPGHVVDAVSADRDVGGHADLNAGGLLFNGPDVVDQVVVDLAVLGVLLGFGPPGEVHLVEVGGVVDVVVFFPDRVDVAHEADSAATHVVDVASLDRAVFVVVIEEDGVAAQVAQLAVADDAVFGSFEVDHAAAVDRPVAAQQPVGGLHEGADGALERQSFEGDVPDREEDPALKNEQLFERGDFDLRGVEVGSLLGIEKQFGGFAVQVPLVDGVELFEDVLDKAVFAVDVGSPVVLGAAFEVDFAVVLFAGDLVVHPAPTRVVHGVEVPVGGVFPASDFLGREAVGGDAVERRRVFGVVRVAGQRLLLAVHKQGFEHHASGHLGFEDASAVLGPLQVGEFDPAQDLRYFSFSGFVGDGGLGRAAVRGGEHHGLG